MAHHVISNPYIFGYKKDESMLYCPMIDARRMEVYDAIYDNQLIKIRDIHADIIDHLSFFSLLQDQKILLFGNGADKCRSTIQHPNALFLDNITTSAGHMARLAEDAWLSRKFVDVAYYEPFYLKDFVATIPTKNIFHSKTYSNPSA
jgi:tRNA threonylcarbamoyladenosine biosynthesis protein TsaB